MAGRPGNLVLTSLKHSGIAAAVLAVIILASHSADVSLTGTQNETLDGLVWCAIWTGTTAAIVVLTVRKRRRGEPALAANYVGSRSALTTWAAYLAISSLLGAAGWQFPGSQFQFDVWGRAFLNETVFVAMVGVAVAFAAAASDPFPAQLGLPGLRGSKKTADVEPLPPQPHGQAQTMRNAPAPQPEASAPAVPAGVEFIAKPDVSFKDVVGLELAKREVREAMQIMRNPKAGAEYGLKPLRGMLMEGPPGTGKTMFGKAVAGEYHANFLSVNGMALKEQWVGSTEKNIRELFAFARSRASASSAPVIIFVDEIDALLPDRTKSRENFDKSMVNAWLQEVDGISGASNILVLGATNFSEAIDAAAKRPGRFDRIVHITLPNESERAQLLRMLFAKRANVMAPDVKAEAWAARLNDWSPAKLTRLVADAAQAAWRANAKISDQHLEQAFELQANGEH